MADKQTTSTEGRGLLTDAERAALAGDRSDSYRYKTRSYLKRRIEKVERDAEVLAEHAPDLLDDLRAAVDATDTHRARAGREPGEERSNEQADQTDAFDSDDLQGDADTTIDELTDRERIENTLAEVDLPSGIDTADAAEAYDAVREHLRAEGPSTKTEIVRAAMPSNPLGYDDDDALDKIQDGARYRGAWWRKIIQPALDADPEVEHRENHHDYNL